MYIFVRDDYLMEKERMIGAYEMLIGRIGITIFGTIDAKLHFVLFKEDRLIVKHSISYP